MKGEIFMSSYFHCLAYDDAQAKIRVEEDAIYMELKEGEIDIHLTFNPIQLLTLNKYLFAALDSVTVGDILDSKNFGNLTVEVENKNIDADNFKIPIGCCDNELVYDYAESA